MSYKPMRRGAACADKANSGVMNLPCIKVAKYCTDKNFAAKLAVNCAKTCGKCGAWQLRLLIIKFSTMTLSYGSSEPL